MEKATTLRVARPTDHLEEIVRFYTDGLGLSRLGSFEDHDGFDGVMLGVPGAAYHLEFTRKRVTAQVPPDTRQFARVLSARPKYVAGDGRPNDMRRLPPRPLVQPVLGPRGAHVQGCRRLSRRASERPLARVMPRASTTYRPRSWRRRERNSSCRRCFEDGPARDSRGWVRPASAHLVSVRSHRRRSSDG